METRQFRAMPGDDLKEILREPGEILREGGYYTTRAAGVDMFPRTPGVEAVLLLEKK